MAGGFVLAHLSDLHLGPLERSPLGLLNAKRVLGAANWHRARKHVHDPRVAELAIAEIDRLGADHIAISGDLCNLGLPAEHERALEALRRWGGEGRISVVPGNHDIYSRIGRDPGTERWRPYMTSCARGLELGGAVGAFPFVRVLGHGAGTIALIGLNSALETPPFRAHGRIGKAQLDAAARCLERAGRAGLVRVVMLHHPPLAALGQRLKELVDAPELEAVLKRSGAELVIYGHNHLVDLRRFGAAEGRALIAGIGSGSARCEHAGEPSARLALYGFGEPAGRVEVRVYGFDPSSNAFRRMAEEEEVRSAHPHHSAAPGSAG